MCEIKNTLTKTNRYIRVLLILTPLLSCSDELDEPGIDYLDVALKEEYFSSFDVEVEGIPFSLQNIASTSQTSPGVLQGVSPFIDFTVNENNTLDILWINAEGKRFLSRVSLTTKSLVKNITIPKEANKGGRFLGFESIGEEKFIIGYSVTNRFGDEDAEARYTAFDIDGNIIFTTTIWGAEDLGLQYTKGEPGYLGSASITYSKADDVIALYLAHTMRIDPHGRGQSGWLGYLDAETGSLLTKDVSRQVIGSEFIARNNVDLRCIVSSDNKFYALAHGDEYPRGLVINRFSHTRGLEAKFEFFNLPKSTTGERETYTTLGDMVQLSNSEIVVLYSSTKLREQRDLRITFMTDAKSGENPIRVRKHTWLTELKEEYVGWGSKLIQFGEKYILVGWNTFDENDKETGSHFSLINLFGEKFSQPYDLSETILYPSQSFKKSSDGRYILFVSANSNKLQIHKIEIAELD